MRAQTVARDRAACYDTRTGWFNSGRRDVVATSQRRARKPVREVSILRCNGAAPIAQIEQLAASINDICRTTTLDLALKVGSLIIQELYAGDLQSWERHGTAHISYRQLSARGD